MLLSFGMSPLPFSTHPPFLLTIHIGIWKKGPPLWAPKTELLSSGLWGFITETTKSFQLFVALEKLRLTITGCKNVCLPWCLNEVKMIFPPYMTVFKWQIFLETCINCLCEVYHFSFEKINLFLLRNLLNVGLRNQTSTLLCLGLTFSINVCSTMTACLITDSPMETWSTGYA